MLSAALLSAALLIPSPVTQAASDNALTRAQALVDKGELSAAADVLLGALDEGTGDARELRLALADLRIRQGHAEQALELLGELPAADDYAVHLALGRAYDQAIDVRYNRGADQTDIDAAFDGAQTHLEAAFDQRPGDDGAAVWELGKFYLYRLNLPDEATALANEALAKIPDDGEALLLRGAASAFAYWNASQSEKIDEANEIWQQAVDDLKQADELLPRERTEPLGQLVWFYEVQNISGKAVDAARNLVDRADEPDLSLLYRLAVKYRTERKYEASGRALEKMVEVSARTLTNMIRAEDDPTATAKLLAGSIDAFYRRGDRAACRSILSAIVAAEPKDHWVWDTYAVICTETSRFDDAVAAYEMAIEIDPENPRTYNDLGALYQFSLQRDADKSKELYEQCIAIADKQLAMENTPDDVRQLAGEAKGLAQGNLNTLKPAGGGLLDSMMAGLRGLNLPKGEQADDDGGGDHDDGDGDDDDDGDAEDDDADGSSPR